MVPVLSASRRQENAFATVHTSGLADSTAGGQCWVFNPKKARSGNVELGLGLLIPTGRDDIHNTVIVTPGGPQVLVTPDYSAQPGQGSWGMVMQWQAFKYVGNQTTIYTDGDYVMTQGGTNAVLRVGGSGTSAIPAAPNAAMTQLNAIQDQYMVEIGAAHPAPKIRGLTLTLGVRDEGVPARNLIGNDLGFRRPGFGIALEPGFIYNRGPHMFQVIVGRAIFRDRTRSVPDQILGGHGDAAFANYIWLAGYTLRLPKRHGEEEALASLNAPSANGSRAKFRPFNLKTLDGTKKTLQDYTNKVTLVAFFFPRCPFCNLELPFEQQMYDKYKDKGLSMVWINILPEEDKLIAPWQADRHFDVPVLVGASEDSLERDYHVTATPTNYLLGQNGDVLYYATGYKAGDEKSLEARIVSALNLAQ